MARRKRICYEVVSGKNTEMSIPLRKKDAIQFKKQLIKNGKWKNLRIRITPCLRYIG